MTKKIYEHEPGQELEPGQIDGMEEMLGDDVLDTDWDLAVENPPSVPFDFDMKNLPHPDKPLPVRRPRPRELDAPEWLKR